MYKKLPLIVLGLGLVTGLALPRPSLADTVIERVARTGVLNVSKRTNLVPFAYVDDQDKLTGYSVELVELIRETLEAELDKEIKIKVVVDDTLDERIVSVLTGEVDIACDTTFTWQRDKFVDFSVAYAISGIKVFVKKDSDFSQSNSLKDRRIGLVTKLINPASLKVIEERVTVVPVESLEAGLEAVTKGEIDGFAFDGTILEGMRQTLDNPDDYKVIPNESYFRHGIACMVPENNSAFLHLVNFTIIRMMDGYINGDPRYVEIVNRYFGKEGVVEVEPQTIKNFFESVIMTREQIPPQGIVTEVSESD
ncbi:MAG: extracellular substrate binding-like orphan protein GrrP [Microcystaceae cyanobacterium]